MEKTPLYQQIARSLDAYQRCFKTDNEFMVNHRADILDLIHSRMPSGSGWDMGTKFDFDHSTPDKLVFYGSFHHMNDHGYYMGWSDHTITVRPSLAFDIDIRISGPNRNDIKDYLHDLFHQALTALID